MGTIDIIPDIHGQIAKLRTAIETIGWRRGPLGWPPPDPKRGIVFLGDFIDRGPENKAVIRMVRDLIDSGKARAIMGNHELNALQFHTVHPETGRPLRDHSDKNLRQHQSFLAEFPLGNSETREALSWMAGLPLFLEADGFRAVHACWSERSISQLRALAANGVLWDDQLVRAAIRRTRCSNLLRKSAKALNNAFLKAFAFATRMAPVAIISGCNGGMRGREHGAISRFRCRIWTICPTPHCRKH